MCPVEDPEGFRKEYVAHFQKLTGEELYRIKAERYDVFLDRVAEVFEYFLRTFDQARYIMTDKSIREVHRIAVDNVRASANLLSQRTKAWHVDERLEYVRAVSRTVVRKIEPLLEDV
jgi:hypothetical protein